MRVRAYRDDAGSDHLDMWGDSVRQAVSLSGRLETLPHDLGSNPTWGSILGPSLITLSYHCIYGIEGFVGVFN